MPKKKTHETQQVNTDDQTEATLVTVRLSSEQLHVLEKIGKAMGIDGRATILKHCLLMRAKELGLEH